MNARLLTVVTTCLIVPLTVLLITVGCGSEEPGPFIRHDGKSTQQRVSKQLFDNVFTNFNQLEDFAPREILGQSAERLNDWLTGKQPQVEWVRDPLLDALPSGVAASPAMGRLDVMRFDVRDAEYLRQSVWIRDVSSQAAQGATDELEVATRLFDWVVRNVQTDLDPEVDVLQPINYWPDETLLFGHGRVIDKSWLFVLLAVQQHLDAVLLALPDAGSPDGYQVWLPAIWHDGELYLFDMRLGSPVPGPDGQGIATLAQVQAKPELLKQLDVEGFPYRIEPEQLKQVVALIVADDRAFSKRMQAVENNLAGDERLLLTVRAGELAERLRDASGIEEVALWQRPFRIIAERQSIVAPPSKAIVAVQMRPFELAIPGLDVNPLWAGRQLQFRGEYDGKESARSHLLAARGTTQNVDPRTLSMEHKELRPILRLTATYWLGHISYDLEQYEVAAEFFGPRLLGTYQVTHLQSGALYNFARAQEEAGNHAVAVINYEQDQSPNRAASLLRKRRVLASLDETQRAAVDKELSLLHAELQSRRKTAEEAANSSPNE